MPARLVDDYERDGFAFRTAVLRADEVDVLNDELGRLLAHDHDPERIILEGDGATVRTVTNPHRYSQTFANLTRHPALVDAARELLRDDVYVFQLGVNCKSAFDGGIWYWHQDFPGYHCDDNIPRAQMVNVLIFLDEVTSLNSPLMLVPGSHRFNGVLPDVSDKGTSYSFRYAEPDEVKAQVEAGGVAAPTGPPGCAIFMHVNTLHGSTANLSPWPRRMVTLTYNAISNKATRPSARPRHIVPDDRDAQPLVALDPDCLLRTR